MFLLRRQANWFVRSQISMRFHYWKVIIKEILKKWKGQRILNIPVTIHCTTFFYFILFPFCILLYY